MESWIEEASLVLEYIAYLALPTFSPLTTSTLTTLFGPAPSLGDTVGTRLGTLAILGAPVGPSLLDAFSFLVGSALSLEDTVGARLGALLKLGASVDSSLFGVLRLRCFL